jgi:hypothetical protein
MQDVISSPRERLVPGTEEKKELYTWVVSSRSIVCVECKMSSLKQTDWSLEERREEKDCLHMGSFERQQHFCLNAVKPGLLCSLSDTISVAAVLDAC